MAKRHDRRHAPRPENELPNHTFYKESSLEHAGETVRYGQHPEHVRRALIAAH